MAKFSVERLRRRRRSKHKQEETLIQEEAGPQQEATDRENDDDDEESDDDDEGNGEMTDGVGRNGSLSVTLTDPDVLDCFSCFDPLTIPVFQCENGHVACSSCCVKLRNKCSACCTPIGYNRCRAIEKVLESIKLQCKNYKYGCKETISYSQRHEHEKTCSHAPCSCPLSDCSFIGSSSQLYQHFFGKHKNSAVQFEYNKVSCITVNINEQFLVLQEETDNVLFILHNHSETIGHVISLSCIAPSLNGGCLYDILARNDGSIVRFRSYTNSIEGKAPCPPPAQGSLLVPSSFFDSQGQLKLNLYIRQHDLSPKIMQRIIV